MGRGWSLRGGRPEQVSPKTEVVTFEVDFEDESEGTSKRREGLGNVRGMVPDGAKPGHGV